MKIEKLSLYIGILAGLSSIIGIISRVFYKSNYSIVAIIAGICSSYLIISVYNKKIEF